MKHYTRVFAAIALAAALSMPSVSLFASQAQEREREKSTVARIVQKLRKIVGITTHEDVPVPPIPLPKP